MSWTHFMPQLNNYLMGTSCGKWGFSWRHTFSPKVGQNFKPFFHLLSVSHSSRFSLACLSLSITPCHCLRQSALSSGFLVHSSFSPCLLAHLQPSCTFIPGIIHTVDTSCPQTFFVYQKCSKACFMQQLGSCGIKLHLNFYKGRVFLIASQWIVSDCFKHKSGFCVS